MHTQQQQQQQQQWARQVAVGPSLASSRRHVRLPSVMLRPDRSPMAARSWESS